jgi:hypothetical protein
MTLSSNQSYVGALGLSRDPPRVFFNFHYDRDVWRGEASTVVNL